MNSPTFDVDVVIVGYGPVGAVLANLLGAAGIETAVFEQTTDVYHLPRAAHFDAEIMRVFETLGLATSVLPATTPVLGMDFVTADGRRLFGFASHDRSRVHGWQASYMFRQPELERALRDGVDRFQSVQVHLACEVTRIDASDDGVVVHVLDLGTGAEAAVTAKYLIGCDGARSIVRKSLNIDLDDSGFDQPWLVVDTVLTEGSRVELPERVLQICNPLRPATFVPSAGRHRRWEFMAVGDETAADLLQPAKVAELLAPWVTVGRDVEIIRSAVYSFHALVATRWRSGRVLLAGDAAHQMPPFLGQGMCSGIRDVANLAWKLVMVLAGQAGDALLDTYQAEREPHVRAITDLAVALGGLIQTTDPAVATARDEGLLASDGAPPLAVLPPLGGDLRYGDHPDAGRPFPQRMPGDDAALGAGFAAVGPLAHESGIESVGGRAVFRRGTETTIVRPDHYVFAVAATDAEVQEAMCALRGRLCAISATGAPASPRS